MLPSIPSGGMAGKTRDCVWSSSDNPTPRRTFGLSDFDDSADYTQGGLRPPVYSQSEQASEVAQS